MKFRDPSNNSEPSPEYDSKSSNFTLCLHFGGHFHNGTFTDYIGGEVFKFDYVEMSKFSVGALTKFADYIGFSETVNFYTKTESGFLVIKTDEQLHKARKDVLTGIRELNIYLKKGDIDLFCSQTGSSKGKEKLNVGVEKSKADVYESDTDVVEEIETDGNGLDFSDEDVIEHGDMNGVENSERGKQMEREREREREREGKSESQTEEDNDSDNCGDSDYALGSDTSGDGLDETDDKIYRENIDNDVEWLGKDHDDDLGAEDQQDDGFGEEDVNESEDDFNSDKCSDSDIDGKKCPVFRPSQIYNPTFELGMVFSNKTEFRKAVHSHAIINKRSIKITKNDKSRVHAKCADSECEWKIQALKLNDECTFQVRQYVPSHTCPEVYFVKNIKSNWLCGKYGHQFQSDPKRKVTGFRLDLIKELRCNITHYQAYRTKQLAMEQNMGNPDEQYSLLWDDAGELKRSNPGSTVILGTDQSSGENRFDRFYVCLHALKMGFFAGCRPLIGVDGCHLKGPHGGVILSAVGIDPNNNTYPIAYAVVSAENGDTWDWFLTILKIDLNIENDYGYTFISDKQKRLVKAFQDVFPNSAHRFCVRHLHGNFRNAGFRGQAFKIAVWRAAKATTVNDFKRRMNELRELDEKAAEWFDDKSPEQWSRSYFNCYPRSDMVSNNICETFNSNILDGREMPILSMLEWIMVYLMKRNQRNRDRGRRWRGPLWPRIKKIINRNISLVGDCIPIKADDKHYQISCFDGTQYSVDLEKGTCGCRKWDLTGIPCKHAISAIYCQGSRIEDYTHKCYFVEMYNKVYEPTVMPINGRDEWEHSDFIPPLPPNLGRPVGRPPKARKREPDEIVRKQKKRNRGQPKAKDQFKLKRQQCTLKCTRCGQEGHNKRCSNQERQNPTQRPQKLQVRKRASQVETGITINASQNEGCSQVTNELGTTNDQTSRESTQLRRSGRHQGNHSNRAFKPPRRGKKSDTTQSTSRQGPSMYQQFQQSQRPQASGPRLNIRAPAPFLGNQFLPQVLDRVPCTSSSSISVQRGKKYMDLSKLPSALSGNDVAKDKGKKTM